MKKGWKDLTEKERNHLKANGITDLKLFMRWISMLSNISKDQKIRRDKGLSYCLECKRIALKLNLPV